jgi:hypothetical protein
VCTGLLQRNCESQDESFDLAITTGWAAKRLASRLTRRTALEALPEHSPSVCVVRAATSVATSMAGKKKIPGPPMLFGWAFEAVAAYFQRQDAAAVLYREWSTHRESGLHYSERDSWDRMLQSGVQLLDRFSQDDRVRIRQPRRNLQVKYTTPLAGQNDFVAYVDGIGELDGTRCLLEWKASGLWAF